MSVGMLPLFSLSKLSNALRRTKKESRLNHFLVNNNNVWKTYLGRNLIGTKWYFIPLKVVYSTVTNLEIDVNALSLAILARSLFGLMHHRSRWLKRLFIVVGW